MMNQGPTILLVEDEVLILLTISDALEDHGLTVVTATRGQAAIDLLSSGVKLDVIVTDVDLPGEMDGLELASRARELRPQIGVVYASGRADLLQNERKVPDARCVQKPFRPSQVCSEVKALVA